MYEVQRRPNVVIVVEKRWLHADGRGVVWWRLCHPNMDEKAILAKAHEVCNYLNTEKPATNRLVSCIDNVYGCLLCPGCGNGSRIVNNGQIVCWPCGQRETVNPF